MLLPWQRGCAASAQLSGASGGCEGANSQPGSPGHSAVRGMGMTGLSHLREPWDMRCARPCREPRPRSRPGCPSWRSGAGLPCARGPWLWLRLPHISTWEGGRELGQAPGAGRGRCKHTRALGQRSVERGPGGLGGAGPYQLCVSSQFCSHCSEEEQLRSCGSEGPCICKWSAICWTQPCPGLGCVDPEGQHAVPFLQRCALGKRPDHPTDQVVQALRSPPFPERT